MKTHPIPFKEFLIPQIEAGIKTETRRSNGLDEINQDPDNWKPWLKIVGNFDQLPVIDLGYVTKSYKLSAEVCAKANKYLAGTTEGSAIIFVNEKNGNSCLIKCPYGTKRDLLWVKETWFKSNGETGLKRLLSYYKFIAEQEKTLKFISPRFMPKAAANLWLHIKQITVQRIQDISDAEAIAEGVEIISHTFQSVM